MLTWITSFLAMFWVVFSLYDYIHENEVLLYTSLYLSLHKSIWSLALSWIVWSCHNGYGGPVNTFLSIPIWRPTARLSFAMYLVQCQFLTYDAGSSRVPLYFSKYRWVI